MKPGRKRRDPVSVRHPHVKGFPFGETVEYPLRSLDDDARMPVLPLARSLDLPAEQVGEELKSVAAVEDRHAQLEEPTVYGGGSVEIHAGGAARQTMARGAMARTWSKARLHG